MTTREKIILGIMAVAVVGGGLHFVLPSTKGSKSAGTTKPATDVTGVVTRVQVAMQEGHLSDREKQILERASAPWTENPFLADPLPPATPALEGNGNEPELPLYTGFFAIGNQFFAILDDEHYRENDLLTDGNYRVTRIFPDRVELTKEGDRPESKVSVSLAEEIENGQD